LVVTFFSLISTFQLETSFLRLFFDSDDVTYRQNLFSTGLMTFLPITIILSGLTILFSDDISNIIFDSLENKNILIVALVRIPFTAIKGYASIVYQVEFDRKGFLLYNLSFIISSTLTSIVLVTVYNMGVMGIILSQTIFTFIYSIIAIINARKYITYKYSKNIVVDMIKYCLPIFPASLSSYFFSYISQGYILFYYSMHSMGIYSVATKIALPLFMMANIMKRAWHPYAINNWKIIDSKKSFNAILEIYVLISISISLILTFFSQQIIIIFATTKYIDSAPLVGILSLTYILTGYSNIIAVGLNITKKTAFLLYTTSVGILCSWAAIYFLAGYIDLIGIALGGLIGALARSIFIIYFVNKFFVGYFNNKKAMLYIVLAALVVLVYTFV